MLASASTASFACPLLPDRYYDYLPNPNLAVVTARVLGIEATSTRSMGTCLELTYSKIDTFIGTVPQNFHAQSCGQEYSIEEFDYTEISEDYGFDLNAVVIVGLVKLRNMPGRYRHAVPGCLGPFHIRLDHLSDGERKKFISEFKDELARNLN